jgi:hypothetical protein
MSGLAWIAIGAGMLYFGIRDGDASEYGWPLGIVFLLVGVLAIGRAAWLQRNVAVCECCGQRYLGGSHRADR